MRPFPRHQDGPTSRSRSGFALFIVLVALLILSMVAVTYLSSIRMRVRDQTSTQSQERVQLVVDSVKSDIIGALNKDYPALGAAGPPEAYDYPWTKASATLMPYTLANAAAGYPTAGMTAGDPACDDAWLASSCPDAATGAWAHVSNLKGGYLKVADCDLSKKSNYPAGGPYVPTDMPSNNLESSGLVARVLSPSAGGDNRLVDTDGDGIGDALWFYPSLNRILDRRYVAAVYIEDLSAKLNVNTAAPLRDGSGAYQANDLLGLSAADCDLSALKTLFGATDAQLANLVKLRSGGKLSFSTPATVTGGTLAPPLDHVARMKYWATCGTHAALDGSPLANDDATGNAGPVSFGTRFGIADETELRFRGGLDRLTSTVALEKILDLRSSSNANTGKQEQLYTDADPTVAGFFRNNPRRWLTGFSGECLERKGPDFHTALGRLDVNLATNYDNWLGLALTRDYVLTNFFTGPNGLAGDADDYPYPCALQYLEPTASSRPGTLAGIAAANLTGARQGRQYGRFSSNMAFPAVGSTWYSVAPLPVMTEVYLQGHTAYWGGGGASYSTTNNGDGTWSLPLHARNANLSYCIELSNPFATPVKLNGIQWSVLAASSIVYVAGHNRLDTALTAASWPVKDQDGDFVLLPGQKLLLYRNGNAGSTAATGISAATQERINGTNSANPSVKQKCTDVAAASAALPYGGYKSVIAVDSGVDFPMPAYSADANPWWPTTMSMVTVEMHAPTPDGTGWGAGANGESSSAVQGYSYLTLPLPLSLQHERSTVNITTDNQSVGLMQSSVKGWGLTAGLDVLQCLPARSNKLQVDRYDTGAVSPVAGAGAVDQGDCLVRYNRACAAYDSTMLDTLGKDNKGVAFPAGRASIKNANDSWWFPTNNWRMAGGIARYANPGRFSSQADVMRIPLVAVNYVANATGRPAGLNNKDAVGWYTDKDVAHALYSSLHNPSSAAVTVNWPRGTAVSVPAGAVWPDVQAMVMAGHSPLDALRLHPWADGALTANYSATTPDRNVPFGWLQELLWSDAYPGQTGGFDWNNADGDNNTLTLSVDPAPGARNKGQCWVDGDANNIGLDTSPSNGWKDWNGTEVDWNDNMGLGRLNINTAPDWLLAEALPIKNTAVRQEVAKIVANCRKGVGNTYGSTSLPSPLAGTRSANDLGIACLCEIVPAVQAAAKANGWDLNGDGTADAKDYSLDSVLATVGPLFQTCSTRSDYFCAHILVQGYNAADFTTDVKESARVMLIIKRSGDSKVIGSFRY